MIRYLKIKNFRNIGITEDVELEINSCSRDQLNGNLVTLVGPNNSGKSNIIEALKLVKTQNVAIDNKPDFIYDDNKLPELDFVLKDDEKQLTLKLSPKRNEIIERKFCETCPESDLTKSISTYIENGKNKRIVLSTQNVKSDVFVINDFNIINNICARINDNWILIIPYLISKGLHIPQQSLASLTIALQKGQINTNEATIKSKLEKYNESLSASTEEENDTFIELERNFSHLPLNSNTAELNGIKLLPNIISYEEKPYSQKDFEMGMSNIANPTPFFKNLLTIINLDNKELNEYYEQYKKCGNNAGILDALQEKFNKELESIAKIFNQLYSADSNQYEFKVKIESTKISFYFRYKENAIPLTIDKQSTGFKWFFNFYFNVIASNSLHKGDIILMDEPATNLHVNGIIELRKFIKDFAIKNGITFIIATHSPFFIDLDYLDELRIVKRIGKESTIINKFYLAAEDSDNEHDTLFEVLSALTIEQAGRSLLCNPDKKLIFVEGITDYNYLISFAKYLKMDKFIFLPVNGIKDKHLAKKLKNIVRNPTILVDNDEAGQIAKSKAGCNGVSVIPLNETNPKYTTIESLFSESDLPKISEENNNKSFKISCEIKNNYNNIDEIFSKETINNFKKLLEYLTIA